MIIRVAVVPFVALAISILVSSPAHAQLMLQPASASTTMGTGGGSPNFTVDKSGLSTGYTSMVTNFNTYIASNPTHNSSVADNIWQSSTGTSVGNFDFDLGGSFTIASFALWNAGSNFPENVIGFTLQADSNPSFSSPITLGSFSANPNTGSLTNVLPEVFSFSPTVASYVRMEITSNNGGTLTRLGEAAFAAVPEPTTWALMGLGGALAVGGVWYRRRTQVRASENLVDSVDI